MAIGDWPIATGEEYEKLRNGCAGSPPDKHPRRCQARNKYHEQCGRWAIVGHHYCAIHGGRRGFLRVTNTMANRYARRVSKKLSDLLEEQSGDSERLKLDDEIDTARLIAEESLKIFDRAFIEKETDSSKRKEARNKLTTEKKAAIIAHVQDSLTHVSQLISRAAKVKALASYTLDPKSIDYLLNQLTKILVDEFGSDEKNRLDSVMKKFENTVTLLDHDTGNVEAKIASQRQRNISISI